MDLLLPSVVTLLFALFYLVPIILLCVLLIVAIRWFLKH